MGWNRYAIYYTPPPGALAAFGAGWLGWDIAAGREAGRLVVPGLDGARLTGEPRRYGFHATLKPPFRLADGMAPEALEAAVADLAARLTPVPLDGLRLDAIGRFLALVPEGDQAALAALAGRLVRDLDRFRAAPDPADLARRRARGLTRAQEANLVRWGYPYVLDEFRFHMTLTGPLEPADLAATRRALAPVVAPLLPRPFEVEAIVLAGEDAGGRFHVIHRYDLTG